MTNDKPQGNEGFRQAAMSALDDFKEEEVERQAALESRDAQKKEKNKLWAAAQWLVLIVCVGVTLYQAPDLILAVTKEEKPLNKGVVKTDALTDQCIRNLWQVSKDLQEGKMPGHNLRCPASNKPYDVVKTGDDIIVRSPNPELYGFKEIRVSRKSPVPEIVK